jgi:hypothetical protein
MSSPTEELRKGLGSVGVDDNIVDTIEKYGQNPLIDSAAGEDIIQGGGVRVRQTADQNLEIVSSSINDDFGSSGAEKVTIFYQNLAGQEYREEYEMNGITAVPLANQGMIAYRAFVSQVGAVGYNEGTITIRVAGAGATLATIGLAKGQTLEAFYRVPAITWKGETLDYGRLKRAWSSMVKTGAAGGADMILYGIDENGSRRVVREWGTASQGQSNYNFEWLAGVKLQPLTEIWMYAETSANGNKISGGFDVRLIGA